MGIQTIKIPLSTREVQPFIKQGDTIPEWSIEFEEGDNINLTDAQIKMQLYQNGIKYIDIDNDNGITINSSLKFTIDEYSSEQNTLPDGLLKGDIIVTFSDGTEKTLYNVDYTILKRISK